MSDQASILEFQNVSLTPHVPGLGALRDVQFRLMAGECLLVRLEPGNEQVPLADMAEGLAVPEAGAVLFMGERWTTMLPEQELNARGRIGRVFDGHGWISNLTVLENVTLAQRHHTVRSMTHIVAEAEALAKRFDLPAVPRGRISGIAPRDLRRAEWVRAFLGSPCLLLLERPTRGVAAEHVPLLIQAVEEARTQGTAVLWTTDDDTIWKNSVFRQVCRYAMKGSNLMLMKE